MARKHDFEISNNELLRLKVAHKKTKSKRKSYRINALILLGQGWTYEAVAEALLIDSKTLRNYVEKYKQGGIPHLLSDAYQSNANKLTKNEQTLLSQHLEEVTYQKVEEIITYVESEFDVQYSRSGMTQLLHGLGFSYKKPRKVPGKADQKKQDKFVKKYKKIRKNMGKDDHLLFVDGVHPQHNPLVMYGWIKKGENKPLYSNTNYHRLNILGAVDIDTHDMVTQFSATLNEEASLDFLERSL